MMKHVTTRRGHIARGVPDHINTGSQADDKDCEGNVHRGNEAGG